MSRAADVLVAGATGALGGAVCSRLRERGLAVRGLVRPGSDEGALAQAGVEIVAGDLNSPGTFRDALTGVGCVVSTATAFPVDPAAGAIERVDRDGTIALVAAAEAAGAERFVFVSFRPVPLAFSLQDAKRAVEERLAASPLDAVVLRPGKFMDIWFSPLCGFDVQRRRATIFGLGAQPVTWIERADVAEIASRAACGEITSGLVELGGPEALTQREVVAIYEDESGAPWAIDEVGAAELERRLHESATEVERSLAAVMLEAHLGAVTDMTSFLEEHELTLTTVREFARRDLAAARSRNG